MSSTAISAQGSAIKIGTGTGGAKTITAIAVGFPTIITSAAHGLSNGDRVTISGVTGADAALLNGLVFTVKNVTTNTFALDVNSVGKTLTATGTATPVTYTAVGNAKSFSGFDGAAAEIDVTNLASTAKEFRLGLIDNGGFSFELDQDNGDGGQSAVRAAQISGAVKDFKLELPGGSTPVASFQGYVKTFQSSGGVDDVVKGSVQIRITGPVAWA